MISFVAAVVLNAAVLTAADAFHIDCEVEVYFGHESKNI
jgi:hypothetical protein